MHHGQTRCPVGRTGLSPCGSIPSIPQSGDLENVRYNKSACLEISDAGCHIKNPTAEAVGVSKLSDETKDIIEQADGFYFSTRYPGDESIEATERDMRRCLEAVEETRELHEELAQYLEREQSRKEEKNKDIGPGY